SSPCGAGRSGVDAPQPPAGRLAAVATNGGDGSRLVGGAGRSRGARVVHRGGLLGMVGLVPGPLVGLAGLARVGRPAVVLLVDLGAFVPHLALAGRAGAAGGTFGLLQSLVSHDNPPGPGAP